MSRLLLFSDRGCPFAHRVLSLARHLGLDMELCEAQTGESPAGIERYRASGGIPTLVDADLVITQSRVMLEHLAERHGFGGALPDDPRSRTLHREAMAVVDAWVAPALRGERDLDGPRLVDLMRTLEAAAATQEPTPCLWVLHVAPIWLHLAAFRPDLPVTRAILARPALRAWLDAAAQLDCVRATWLSDAELDDVFSRARAAGLVPPDATRSAS